MLIDIAHFRVSTTLWSRMPLKDDVPLLRNSPPIDVLHEVSLKTLGPSGAGLNIDNIVGIVY